MYAPFTFLHVLINCQLGWTAFIANSLPSNESFSEEKKQNEHDRLKYGVDNVSISECLKWL